MKQSITQQVANITGISDNLSLEVLRDKIRFGTEPDNPALIRLWFSLDSPNPYQSSISQLRQHHEEQFKLLLETVADELIPAHWRCLCLDNIYKPLCSLQKISNDEESELRLKRLFNELSITTRYVEHSLYY